MAGGRWARFVLRYPVPVLLGRRGRSRRDRRCRRWTCSWACPATRPNPTATTERRAYDALAEGFGAGFNGPLTIVVDARGAEDPQAAVRTIADADRRHQRRRVRLPGPVQPGRRHRGLLRASRPPSPTDEKTKDLVNLIRAERAALEAGTGATFQVTGTTAVNIDVAQKVQDALVPYLPRGRPGVPAPAGGVPVAARAAQGGARLPAVGAGGTRRGRRWCSSWGTAPDLLGVEQTGPIMSMMPIFLVGIVFGLAMDYEVFLVSRMREAHVHGEPARAGGRVRLPAQRPRGGRRRADHDGGLRRLRRRRPSR